MILQPQKNVWRIERAQRAAVLIDGAVFFRAVREAMLKARRRIFIVGWDIHSQTRLVDESGEPQDGYPAAFGGFLSALAKERRELAIRLLLWDYSILYAVERELFPTLTLRWNTPSQVHFCLDNAIPIGSSQHQKLIVVDDSVAFSGGLDVTIRRWDTSEHSLDNPHRVDVAGKPYRPFHDVQAVVDGAAAHALSDIVRARWACASGDRISLGNIENDAWPDSITPDFLDCDVGIARTQPLYDGQQEIREVEQLFIDSIDAAEASIYIENQFLTSAKVAQHLAQRMLARPRLELLMVAPQNHESWLEARTMRNGRIRFMRILQEAGVGDRARLVYPEVSREARSVDTMIHSKIMIVDDRLLRVGSANLNNRSMGIDTECDLAFEADGAGRGEKITEIRNRLIGDHCGVAAPEVAAEIARTGSMLKAADQLQHDGHRLRPVDDGIPDHTELSVYLEGVADPEHPIDPEAFVSEMLGGSVPRHYLSAFAKLVAAGLVVLLLALAWHYTPLAKFAEPEVVRDTLSTFARGPWAPAIVLAVFVGAGLVVFPLTILIVATAAAFGPWLGFVYAAGGALASALVTYLVGARIGKESLRNFLGPRLNRIRRRIARQGVIAVAAIRLVPIAPFTIVNLVAGASQIRLIDYMAGTALGLAPGLLLLSALGHQVLQIMLDPAPIEIALLIAAVVAWISLSIGVQFLVSKRWSAT